MSEIALSGRAVPTSPQQAAGSSAPGTVTDPPAGVLKMAQGSLLHGVVTGQIRPGHVLVQTDQGMLEVTTKLPLPVGREVSLQIRSAGSQLHITILPLDPKGQPPAGQTPPPQPAATAPSGTVPAGAAPASAPQGAIQSPPPAAANLPVGSQLPVTVLSREGDGSYLLRSEHGLLKLSTDAVLARGNLLTLQVRQSIAELQVLVLARPGTAGPQAAGTPGATGAPPQGVGHATPTADQLEVGPLIRAVVVSKPGGRADGPGASGVSAAQTGPSGSATPAPAAASNAPLPAGTALGVRIQQILPPGTGSGSSAPTPQGPASAAATGLAAQPPSTPTPPTPATVQTALAALSPGALGRATDLLAVTRHAEGSSVLQGRVIGHAGNGQPLVETAVGTLQLSVRAELPVGARLMLALPQGLDAPELPIMAKPEVFDSASLARRWPALESLIQAMDEAGLQVQAGATAPPGTTIPQPGARLASGILFFLNALTGGNPTGWLDGLMGGRPAGLLEFRGRHDLLGRLRGDLGRMANLGDAGGPDWRLLPVPFFDGQSVQQLRFFFRRHDEQEGDGRDGGGDAATRFMLDVELTRLGPLQFDGLVRPRRFDMILRSRDPLPDWMQRDIARIFEHANEAADANGRLSFQASRDWSPVAIAESPDAPDLRV